MKKITFLFFLFSVFYAPMCVAQSVSSYSFSQSTEVYTPVVGTNSTATGDDGSENGIAIGFPFNYGGVAYTTFSINTNGWIRLGANVGAQPWVNVLSNSNANTPLIAAFWDDHNRTTGSIQYVVTGSQPNRILEIGWDSINLANGGVANTTGFGSFKMRLYEANGQIEFVYGPTMETAGAFTASIGLNDNTSFLSVTPGTTATASNTSANNAINSTGFVVGQQYSFAPQPACSGLPTPGNATTTSATTCAGNSFTLGIQNLTPGYGVTYQWLASTNGTNFNVIAGANAPTYVTTQSVATSYECNVTCSGNTATTTPVLIGMNDFNTCYCTPTYTSGKTDGDLISNVMITGTSLSNNTGTAPVNPSYTYFTGQSNYTASLEAGASYEMSITVGTYDNQNDAVWIDYNDDGIFSLGERVGFSSSIPANGTRLFTITLACNASIGIHRMRIRDVWNNAANAIDPCANYGYGETEDYDIEIIAPTSCQAPTALAIGTLFADGVELGWQAGCYQTGWDLHITPQGGGSPIGAASNPNVTNPATINGLQGGTIYEAYVRGNCNANGYSTWIGPIVFTTLAPAPANDDCDGAVNLLAGGSFDEYAVVGTNVSASKTTGVPGPTCATFGFGGDVWYSMVVPDDGNITIETQANPGSPITDTVLMAFTGDCLGLTVIGCSDDDGLGAFSRLDLTGQTPGTTIYARVWEFANDTFGTFRVSAWNTTLTTRAYDNSPFKVYPNPVKDLLEISASQKIVKAEVYNLLGQQVVVKQVNSNQGKIDTQALPQGTYIVKIFTQNNTKTIKVIKE